MRRLPSPTPWSRFLWLTLSMGSGGLSAAAMSTGCGTSTDNTPVVPSGPTQDATGNTGGGSPTCVSGQTACGNSCVDLTSDSAHCGSCGSACEAGRICQAGTCTCATPLVACSGGCVNTQESAAH